MSYSSADVQRARDLREAGWSLDRIADLVGSETESRPPKSTVWRWVNPDASRTSRETAMRWWRNHNSRNGGEAAGRLGCAHHTKEYQEARAYALIVNAGMLLTQVARAMAFDYPQHGWTEHRVRALAVRMGVEPNPNMVRASRKAAA